MKILIRPLTLLGLLVLSSGMTARAQYAYTYPGPYSAPYYAAPAYYYGYPNYWYWAGSTVQGDILRGMGAYGIGAGVYNHETAIGEAINAQTAARIFLLEEEYIRQQDLRYRQKEVGARVRNALYQGRREDQLLNHPELRDVMVGDSLNRLMSQLTRLGDYLLMAKASTAPIHCSLVKSIPFLYAPTGKTITLESVLSEPMPRAFRRIVVDRDPGRFEAFVRKVARSPEISLGDLIIFMHGFSLRFGVAEGSTQRGTYGILQTRLSALRKEVMNRPAQDEGLGER
jgi:hypothetical protein